MVGAIVFVRFIFIFPFYHCDCECMCLYYPSPPLPSSPLPSPPLLSPPLPSPPLPPSFLLSPLPSLLPSPIPSPLLLPLPPPLPPPLLTVLIIKHVNQAWLREDQPSRVCWSRGDAEEVPPGELQRTQAKDRQLHLESEDTAETHFWRFALQGVSRVD